MNIVQRNMQRSLAKTVTTIAAETGMNRDEVVQLLNDQYGYVPQDDSKRVDSLKKQVELDQAADDHAKRNKVSLSKLAVAKTIADREAGRLSNKIGGTVGEVKPD